VWCKAADSYKQSPELQSPESRAKASKYAVFFQTLRYYQQAEAVCPNVLQAAESQYDPDRPKVLVTLKDLASLLGSQSNHIEAEDITRRVVKACDRVFGSTHYTTISSYCRLGKALMAQRKFSEAEDCFRRCYSIKIELYGEHHMTTLKSLCSLASVL
jgi:tetratricopeptide (TPR) repeat protein